MEYQSRTRGSSKRLPNLTYEELEEQARENGVGEIYSTLVNGLARRFQRYPTRTSIGFAASISDSRKSILSLMPRESSANRGLRFRVYIDRFASVLKMSPEEAAKLLPEQREDFAEPDFRGYVGYFCSQQEVERFLQRVEASLGSEPD